MSNQNQSVKHDFVKGSARALQFGKVKLSLKLSDLQRMANEAGYVNIIVAPKPEEDQYKNTHMVYKDDWKPGQDNKQQQGQNQYAKKSTNPRKAAPVVIDEDEDDLPF